ncbi:Hcp family type VI secretion system effector [Methylolobus aquaticus]
MSIRKMKVYERHSAIRPALAVVCFMAAVAPFTVAEADTRTYMLVPGVAGASLDKDHAGWIEASAFSLKLTRNNCSGLTIRKELDIASPALSAAAVLAQRFKTIELESEQGGENRQVFLKLTLSRARIASVDTGVAGGTEPLTETLVVRAGEVKISYYPQNADGSLGDPVESVISCDTQP